MFRRKKTVAPPPVRPAPVRQVHEDNPDWLTLSLAGNPREAVAWLRARGYRGVPIGLPGCADVGLLYSCGGGPVRLAVMGDTLQYRHGEVTQLT